MARYYGLLIAFLLLGAGCAQLFTAKTRVTYKAPDGREISYESDKEQVGLKLNLVQDEDGKIRSLTIDVDKSGTPEAATAAALQAQLKTLMILESALKGAGKMP